MPPASRVTRRALAACWLALLARLVLVIGVLTVPAAFVRGDVWESIYLSVLAAFVLTWGASIALSLTVRCPRCRRRFLLPRPPWSRSAKGKTHHLQDPHTAVWDIVRVRNFVCGCCAATCGIQ
jgi:hypothetical protein